MYKKWLILILLLAAFFRFFHLTSSPPGLNWDEVSIGYNAYSVLKTGRDEWGQFLPLSFKAFGEQKLPGMIYASIPGIALFGTTDFGVRVTPALIGMLAVWLIYLLSKKYFHSEPLALIASFLLAISPWAVHFSRVSFEAGLAMVFVMASIYFLPNLWLSMIFAVLAVYTYNSVRILLPLMFIVYLINGVIIWRKETGKKLLQVLLVGVILITPIIIDLAKPEGRVRLGTVSISTQKSFLEGIAESRGYTKLPGILPKLIHNKATHYSYALFTNYLHIFSTEFLYFSGGENSQRSVQGIGLLHLFELPIFILGLLSLLKKAPNNDHLRSIILPWLLLSPIPSIITIDSPSTVRALNVLPALIMIESIGAMMAYSWLKQHKVSLLLATIFIVWNISYLAYLLFFVYPVKYSDKWLYGYQQAISFIQANYAEANKIYLTTKFGEPYIYTLFYSGFDPHKFQTGKVEREVDPLGWVHVRSFDKYIFSDFSGLEEPKEIVSRGSGKLIMVTGFTQLPSEYQREFALTAPNWEVMFEGTIQKGMQ